MKPEPEGVLAGVADPFETLPDESEPRDFQCAPGQSVGERLRVHEANQDRPQPSPLVSQSSLAVCLFKLMSVPQTDRYNHGSYANCTAGRQPELTLAQ
eukprot:64688-Rhodomonas_salina.2